jgi:Mg2+/citrate symporter
MMSIAVRALGIAVIVMMAVLAIQLLNEREQLSHNLEDTPRSDKRSQLRWKMKILGSRRKLKQGRLALSQMMLTFLIGFLTMRAYANEYYFMIGGGISMIIFVRSFFVWKRITRESRPVILSGSAARIIKEFFDDGAKKNSQNDDESKKDD